ncbi:MAG: helix-turn-helix transcriptional regulator [Hydrogenoanaerobacterium sp.]
MKVTNQNGYEMDFDAAVNTIDAELCSLSSHGKDCHNNPLNKIAYLRKSVGLTQNKLSELSHINIRQIQRIEGGGSEVSNITLKNAIALADALGVEVRELI